MRLIDADALCEEFKERQRAALRWKEKAILDGDEERQIRADATLAFLSEVKLTIDKAPTVEERPHGKWQEYINEKWGGTTIYCPYCKEEALEHSRYIVTRQVKSNFCPNCGADMRGGQDNDPN